MAWFVLPPAGFCGKTVADVTIPAGSAMTDFAMRRTTMVDCQVRTSDVTKFPVIDAMLTIPREDFVPVDQREAAYLGENLPISKNRVLLEPRSLSKLLDALDVQPNDLVLDLGCGLGYSSAVIALLAEAVVAVEDDETMAADAQARLSEGGIDNAAVITADLASGAAKHGPYDVIVVQGAVEQFPDSLLTQLKEGGRVGCIFMEGSLGIARIGYKSPRGVTWRDAFNASAPVLPGFGKSYEFAL